MKNQTKCWGILGALDREIALLRNQMQVESEEACLGTTFLSGTLCGQRVVVACCGIGKVNAAACTTYLIYAKGCDIIVNVGIAGGVGKGLKTLDVVISRELCFHDQDPVMLKYFPARQFFEADASLRALCCSVCSTSSALTGSWREGRIATGDRFVADSATRDAIVAAVAPDCVEMEGAAIAHVATAAGKPFLVIRSMSDCADDDASTTYDNFLERAADQSAGIILGMLQHAD
ncbi:MAG: 5'-methylthioadenosine/adenosylhomocysteine nucleosidase [Kiritimatiellae bacterium]|nr:5'-methylthioadenosine/adenosylhomocysteine nucleosidase [Kiritimatiellia bacterium]